MSALSTASTLTSREIVRRTLDRENPPRVARSFAESDFVGAGCSVRGRSTSWSEVGGGRWERLDEWGNTWARVDPTSKGEVARGVLRDLNDLDRYEFLDYSRPEDYENVARVRGEKPDKWLIAWLPGFAFNIARKMRTMEQYLIDLLVERDRIRALHDRIDGLLENMIRNHARAGADSVMFPEDWGTQQQTLIAPALWREEFFPRFRNLCALAHDLGLRVFMHSCGAVGDIVPGLIEAGIDVLQFDQPDLHGIDNLARHQENARIAFWCPVDIQKVLPTGDERLIRAKAREMVEKLWRGRGGFIAGFYGDMASIGVRPEWQQWACEEFTRCGIQETRAVRSNLR
ncbi:hypothetical protein JW916_02030 [Candidatus Sumerlaeota bacterium]|nr:hypothetical protein [Candidatus Sumerlaeota bacterium]